SSLTGGTADRNRSHWSTSKTPSYTKSVSWQHHRLSEDIIITVRQKGFSVAPNTLVIPLSDEECENMNRVTLTHYQNNKVVGFISEDKEKPDTHLNLPLIENSSNHGSDLMANKPEEGEKVSERLHVTFKIPIWLIALIVVMIVINIIVLVVLNR
ncbi:hypothetical protein ABKH70_13025, partial [Klebsiella pneumoniae]